MHLRSALVFVAMVAAVVATVGAVEVPIADTDEAGPPVKLDKNLRRALLKALADLEAESVEQEKSNEDEEDDVEEGTPTASIPTVLPETAANENLEKNSPSRMTYSFNGFLGEGEFPSEEKLQNSTFVEIDKYTFSSPGKQATANEVPAIREESKSQQIHDLVSAEKSAALYLREPLLLSDDIGKDQGTRSIKGPISLVNSVQSVSSKPITQLSENLARSASSNIAAATGNSLTSPKPTASSLTTKSKSQLKENSSPAPATGSSKSKENLDEKPEVKIFQAPLVAAFTVQQDERGVPKSVVPIYRPNGDGQALTLQEQLEFKQQQLEKQILDLQRQQVQQTQFLARQQQLYEEQLRFKQQQQQEIYLREQARLKQLEEQRIYQHRIQQQQQQQRLQQASFDQNSLTLQPSFDKPGIQFQPSVSLQLPNIASPPLFQSNYQEQLQLQRLQQRQRQQQQQQQQQQQLQLQQQQQQQQQLQLQQQQQRLQQSFGAFPNSEFQNPGSRLNRQEVFGSTGNFGFNSNKNFNARGNFGGSQLNAPFRNIQNFGFDGFNQFRQARPQTPARQIQHLLYQSGVASDLGTTRGSGGAEDLNIVSKVLALNVGALPSNSLQFGASKRVNSFAKPPNAA